MKFKNYLLEEKKKNIEDYAKEYSPDLFIIGKNIPAPNRKGIFYISTGQKGVYYTLRQIFLEPWGHGNVKERDYLVLNLGPNPEKAIKRIIKEKPKYGYNKVYISNIKLRPKAKNRPPDMIKFGKFAGESVYQVADNNPEYVLWLYTEYEKGKKNWIFKYKTFIPHLEQAFENPKVASLIEKYKIEQKKEEIRQQAKEIKKEEYRKKFQPIIDALKETGSTSPFIVSMIQRLEQGENPAEEWSDKMIRIVGDIYGKYHGRRNSKKYKKAVEFWEDLVWED